MKQNILVVEDNETDEKLTLRAIQQAELKLEVRVARDGEEACTVLFGECDPPHLVILDLDLPRMDGIEVLQRMRSTEATRNVPVVIFSSTNDSAKISRCYELSANSFLRKPLDAEIYDSQLKLALYYWLGVNQACN